MSLDAFFNGGADSWPAERFARLYGPLKASTDSLADHAAFKLGKCAGDLIRVSTDRQTVENQLSQLRQI